MKREDEHSEVRGEEREGTFRGERSRGRMNIQR